MMIKKSIFNSSFLFFVMIVIEFSVVSSCHRQNAANKLPGFNLHSYHEKSYIKPIMRADTSFSKYEAEISDLVNTTYPKFGNKVMVVRVFVWLFIR